MRSHGGDVPYLGFRPSEPRVVETRNTRFPNRSLGMMTCGTTPASTLCFPNSCILPVEDTAPYKGPNLMRTGFLKDGNLSFQSTVFKLELSLSLNNHSSASRGRLLLNDVYVK